MRVAADPEAAGAIAIFALVLAAAILGGLAARRLRLFELRAQLADDPEPNRCGAPHPHEAFHCTRLPHDDTALRHHNHDRNRSWGLPHLPARPGGTR